MASPLEWFVLGVFALLAAGGIVWFRQVSSEPGEYMVHALSFFLPSAIARGARRAFGVLLAFSWGGVVTLLVSFLFCAGSTPPHTASVGCYLFLAAMALLVFGALGLAVLIILFNRPRRLVPSSLRSEPGAIAEWWNGFQGWRRRHRRGRPGKPGSRGSDR